jgi:hypothetical protein
MPSLRTSGIIAFALAASVAITICHAGNDGLETMYPAGWKAKSTSPGTGVFAMTEDGIVVMGCRGVGRQTLIGDLVVPAQHELTFEFLEPPSGSIAWDVQYVSGTSRFDGLPFIVYQLQRDGRFGAWTRSEQGWIAQLGGAAGLGLRDVIDVAPGKWHRVQVLNDAVTTLVRVWAVESEQLAYEAQMSHDECGGSSGRVLFNCYGYLDDENWSLLLRNIRVIETGSRVVQEVARTPVSRPTTMPAAPERKIRVKVPSAVTFRVKTDGLWQGSCQNWTLKHDFTDGKDAVPYLSPRLVVAGQIGRGLDAGRTYNVRVLFTHDKDTIEIQEDGLDHHHSRFLVSHKPTTAVDFVINDGESHVLIEDVAANPGGVSQATVVRPAVPEGYELVIDEDFSTNLGKWGAPQILTTGQLRLERFRHWCESGILEIPYLSATDFIIDAMIMQAEGPNGLGIMMRMDPNDDSSFRMFKINTKSPCMFAEAFSFDNDNHLPVPVMAAEGLGGMLRPRCWQQLRIEAEGSSIRGYIDGRLCAEYQDASPRKGGVALVVDPGTELYVRSFRVYCPKESDYSYSPRTEASSPPKLVQPSRPFPLVSRQTPGCSEFKDAAGRSHYYRIDGERLLYNGQHYYPVKDSDGQYFVRHEPQKWPQQVYASLIETDGRTIDRIRRYGLNYQIVPTQITTHIDCTTNENGFSEDNGLGGASRLLDIDGVTYRVTSARKGKNNYYLYSARFPKIGSPYVMVYQVPNDRYRMTSICPIPPESGSAGVFTGGPFQTDNKSHNMMHLFYPTQEQYAFCVYHQEITRDWAPNAGAAVANMWFLLIEQDLADIVPVMDEKVRLPVRTIGTIDQEPTFTRKLYGAVATPKSPLSDHKAAMNRYIDYVQFCGGNMVNYYFLGNDWALDGRVHYPSKLYKDVLVRQYDYVDQFLTVAQDRQMATYPRIAGFTATERFRTRLALGPESLVVNKDGDYVTVFSNRMLDPLNPRVQQLFKETIDELAEHCVGFPNVSGFCLELGPGGWLGSCEVGYSRETVARFSAENGVQVEYPSKGAPYQWLRENCWEAWIDWRCQKIAELYIAIHDRIRAKRSDWTLQLKLNGNAMTGLHNLSPDVRLQRMREMGVDPRMLKRQGIDLNYALSYQDSYINHRRSEFENLRLPIEGATGLVNTVSYYELGSVFSRISPLHVSWLATVNVTPVGRNVLEWSTAALRTSNVVHLEFMRWEKAIAQMEHLLRRFSTAFRALPAVAPEAFDGEVEILRGDEDRQTLGVRWHTDRLMVLNDSPFSREIRITIPRSMGPHDELVELGRNETLVRGSTDGNSVTVELDLAAFDLQVLSIRKIDR